MASIWHHDETPGYDKGKAHTSFTKWRVMVVERTAELTSWTEARVIQRLNAMGLHALGVAYDEGVTAEDLAREFNEEKSREHQ